MKIIEREQSEISILEYGLLGKSGSILTCIAPPSPLPRGDRRQGGSATHRGENGTRGETGTLVQIQLCRIGVRSLILAFLRGEAGGSGWPGSDQSNHLISVEKVNN